MKKHVSFLLFVCLFLHSFSALYGMQKTVENVEEEYVFGRNLEPIFENIPNEVIFEIFQYLDVKDFKKLRLVKKRFKELIENSTVHVTNLKDFENGFFEGLFKGPGLKHKKIKELVEELEDRVESYEKIYFLYKDDYCNLKLGPNKLIKLDKENIENRLFRIFEDKIYRIKEKNKLRLKVKVSPSYILSFLSPFPAIMTYLVNKLTGIPSSYLFIGGFVIPYGFFLLVFIYCVDIKTKFELYQKKEIFIDKVGKKINILLKKINLLIDDEKERDILEKTFYTKQELLEKKNK